MPSAVIAERLLQHFLMGLCRKYGKVAKPQEVFPYPKCQRITSPASLSTKAGQHQWLQSVRDVHQRQVEVLPLPRLTSSLHSSIRRDCSLCNTLDVASTTARCSLV